MRGKTGQYTLCISIGNANRTLVMTPSFVPKQLSNGVLPRRVVIIGGGTGSATVVRAFTQAPFDGVNVTAIATTFDDGGGTGELRKVYPDLPAVGDLRQCFDAMSSLSPAALRALASRFGGGGASNKLNVEGQTLGNLMIARIIQTELQHGGTFSSALDIVSELFQIKGTVAPPSNDIRTLVFDLPDGTRIFGEHTAEETKKDSFRGARISFRADRQEDKGAVLSQASISKEADHAIREADMVILAPGDLYTSVGPNLAVRGMREALESARLVIMISNLMNRDRHTVGFTTADYVEEYTRIIGAPVIHRVIYNTSNLDPVALKAQAANGSYPVYPDLKRLQAEGCAVRGFDLLSRKHVAFDPHDAIAASRSQIRHSPAKLAIATIDVYLGNHFRSEAAQ